MTISRGSTAIDDLRARGYVGDFVIDTDAIPPGIRCRTCGRGQFVERALIAEATPIPSPSATGYAPIVLGLSCPRCTTKGVLLVADDAALAAQDVIRVLRDRANDVASRSGPGAP